MKSSNPHLWYENLFFSITFFVLHKLNACFLLNFLRQKTCKIKDFSFRFWWQKNKLFFCNPWGNLRAQTTVGLQKSCKIRKNSIFFIFVKTLDIHPDGSKSLPKHPLGPKRHPRHPRDVIWKFYPFWKFDFFEASKSIFEFWRISLKTS